MQILTGAVMSAAIVASVFFGIGDNEDVYTANFESVEIGIEEFSPKGAAGGIAVPASGGSGPSPTASVSQVCINPTTVRVTVNSAANASLVQIEGNMYSVWSLPVSFNVADRSAGNSTIDYTVSRTSGWVGGKSGDFDPGASASYSQPTLECATPPPTVVCSSSPASATTGQNVRRTATATGGSGVFTYQWTGTDSLSGNTATVNKTYTTPGTKTGSVRVTSGGITSAWVSCGNVTVSYPTIGVTCAVSPASATTGQNVRRTATATGGNGTYAYQWSGTDSLTGSTRIVDKSYTTAGTKTGSVRVTSGGVTSAWRSCPSVTVSYPSLSVSCSVSPTSAAIGQNVRRTATATGGSGTYTYNWSGTDSLSGSARIVDKSYTTAGTKTGSVRVTSGGSSATRACSSVTVNAIPPTITGTPGIVRMGEPSTISWTIGSSPASNCSITGPGLNLPSLTGNGSQSVNINAESVFTISCLSYGTDSVTIEVLPRIQET